MFRELDTVVIKALITATRHVDGSEAAKRQPRVGDQGTIVHVIGPQNYVVESVDSDGMTLWLADFRADELAPLPSAGAFPSRK
jgi:hypothetical protein